MKTKKKLVPKVKKGYDNMFQEIIDEINLQMFVDEKISLKTVQRGTQEMGVDVSYPVLLDLKNKKRNNFHERTLSGIVAYLNSLGKYHEEITNDFLMKRKTK